MQKLRPIVNQEMKWVECRDEITLLLKDGLWRTAKEIIVTLRDQGKAPDRIKDKYDNANMSRCMQLISTEIVSDKKDHYAKLLGGKYRLRSASNGRAMIYKLVKNERTTESY